MALTRVLMWTFAATAVALAVTPAISQDEPTRFAVPIDLGSAARGERFAIIMTRSESRGFSECPDQIRRAPRELSRPQPLLGSLDNQPGGRCVPLAEGGCFCTGQPGILGPIIISEAIIDTLNDTVPSAMESGEELQFSADTETLEVLRLESR